MHIALITAGGAGMFCGSCMHDNTWARALMEAGTEVSLLPTYTPLRLDETSVSDRHVWLGGINVYLEHRLKLWQRLPRPLRRVLDHPALINLATRMSLSNDAAELGDLALDMLAGEAGPNAREVDELTHHVAAVLKPDVVIFSNALLSGTLRSLKQAFSGPVFCTLQGDDVFLNDLPDSHQSRVIDLVSRRAQQFDGYLVHSRFYQQHIAEYLQLPLEKFSRLPLGIDLQGHDGQPGQRERQPFTVGYFARIAPEKGLHNLVKAFALLHQRRPEVRLRIGGYLDRRHRRYFEESLRELPKSGARSAVEYVGSPTHLAEKVAFYRSIDVLSVPTDFLEPKGLYVLEALANGVPVVQPAHGAFPELIEATGGGRLVPPGDATALADALEDLLDNPEMRVSLGATGQINVREQFNPQVMVRETLRIVSARR